VKLIVVDTLEEFLGYHRDMTARIGGVFAEESRVCATNEYFELSHFLKKDQKFVIVYDKNGKFVKTVIRPWEEIIEIVKTIDS